MRKMLRLTTDQSGLNDFNDNYCRLIIDKMAGLVQVTEISAGDENTDWLNKLMEQNSFEAVQGMWWRGAIREGDSFIMIDPASLRWVSEPAYDGFSGVVAIFDNVTREPVWACKLWSESDQQLSQEEKKHVIPIRIVVYQPDRITWWRGTTNGAGVFPDRWIDAKATPGEPVLTSEAVAEENIEETNKPPADNAVNIGSAATGTPVKTNKTNEQEWTLGFIPLIHFTDQQDNYTLYGDSEIRAAIPLQDVLNRTLHSMVMASEFSAFPIKWSIGMALDVSGIQPGAVLNLVLVDKDGKALTELTEEQVALMNAIKVGQFSSADLNQYIQQIDQLVRQMSQCTQTPIYGVTSERNLSGEALKQLEIGLIGKVLRFQHQNTDGLKALIKMTADIQNAFDTGQGTAPDATAEDFKVTVTWKNPEILDADQQVAALVSMRQLAPGLWDDDYYRTRIGGLLGMSSTQVKLESQKAKTAQASSLDNLIGNNGAIPPDTAKIAPQNNPESTGRIPFNS
jgi:hypothetical protein